MRAIGGLSIAKAERNVGQEILEGMRQLKRGEHGRVMKVPSISGIREKTCSQPRFAELLGVSVRTVQEWELVRASCTIRRSANIATHRGKQPSRSP